MDRADVELPRLLEVIARAADLAGVGIAVTTTADPAAPRLVYANAGLGAMLGYDPAALRAQPPWDLVAPQEQSHVGSVLVDQRGTRDRARSTRTVLRHAEGHDVQVDASTARVDTVDGTFDVSFLVHAGPRPDAEQRVLDSERRLRALIDHAPDGILMLRWPRILFLNRAAAPMLGFADVQSAQGQDIRDRLRLPDPAPKGGLEAVLETPGSTTTLVHADPRGVETTLEVSSVPTEYEGQPAVLCFARDVTERTTLMSKMVEADKLATIGTIAAGVAHEINNPLAYVMLNLEFLARDAAKLAADAGLLASFQQRLADVRHGTERVKEIVRELQTFTYRPEEIRGPVDLEGVLDHALHMARHEIQDRGRVLRRFQLVPPVHGNATRLEQLFLNLLVNAAQALDGSDPKTATIEVVLRHTADWVLVEVRDNGCGMTAEQRARAFEAFYTTKPQGVGTGLGLAICRDIVRTLGGEVDLDSTPGIGTTVRVRLRPEVVVKRTSAAPVALEPAPSSTEEPTRGQVLIVDDDVGVAESLGHALREHHEVEVAKSVGAAREHLTVDGLRFDVILCDLVMPGESGMDLYEDLARRRPELCDRFVFMSGGTFLPRAEAFLAKVDNPRIDKPFDLHKLAQLIQQRVELRRGAGG